MYATITIRAAAHRLAARVDPITGIM
jgi:hypothetical protein